MQPQPNQFCSPKKPVSQDQCVDEWAKVERLKRRREASKTEEQQLRDLERYEESDFSDLSSDSQTELPIERINSTPRASRVRKERTLLAHPAKPGRAPSSLAKGRQQRPGGGKMKRPYIPLEPFNMRDERENNLIDSKGNFLYKNYREINPAWLISLNEEVADPSVLKNRQKTIEYAAQKKISRAQSEASSLKSLDEPITSESCKEKKLETMQAALLTLLKDGESPNKAVIRIYKQLPGKKIIKPFKRNVRKGRKGGLTRSAGAETEAEGRAEEKKSQGQGAANARRA